MVEPTGALAGRWKLTGSIAAVPAETPVPGATLGGEGWEAATAPPPLTAAATDAWTPAGAGTASISRVVRFAAPGTWIRLLVGVGKFANCVFREVQKTGVNRNEGSSPLPHNG